MMGIASFLEIRFASTQDTGRGMTGNLQSTET